MNKCSLIPKTTFRVTLIPGWFCLGPPILLWFPAILKEIINSPLHLAWLGRDDNPPNKDRIPLCKWS